MSNIIQEFFFQNIVSYNHLKRLSSKFKRVMIVCGKNSFQISGGEEFVLRLFHQNNIILFNDFSVNPDISEISKGAKVAKEFKPNAILAIGGGSVIDAAKIIKLMFCYNLNQFETLDFNYRKYTNLKHNIPLIVVPTTAGTGSESTHFAVAYKDEVKYSIASKLLLPQYVYLDVSFCLSNSVYQNACSGFDALAQGIESYWSRNANHISKYYAKKSIKIILANFENAIFENKNRAFHLNNMLIASNFSGKAINISKTTGPHAISYGITKAIGLPHGHAVAITLGAFFKIHKRLYESFPKNLKSSKLISKYIMKITGKDAYEYLYRTMNSFGMEFDLKKLGIDRDTVNLLVSKINPERMANHPVKLDESEIYEIFKLVPKNNPSH